ncbi:MAG: hypothetical protein RR060_01885 [Victivallaceae bacterium]
MSCDLNEFKVVVWGDSIGGMMPEPWPEKMQNSYNACLAASCRLEVVNSAICGIAAADAKGNFERDVATHQPDLVIIQYRPVSFVVLPSNLTRGDSVLLYNQAAIAAAKEAKVEFLDIQQIDIEPLKFNDLVVADGVHLSDWGKMVYSHNTANRVAQIIRCKGR